MLSFEEMERTLLEACENGFPQIPQEEREKQLEEQRKMGEEIERRFSPPNWEYMQRRFTI